MTTKGSLLGKTFRLFAALALAALCTHARATAVTTDVTDIWYNASKNGFGVNLIQEHDTVFATLFIYGPNQQPTWAVATLRHVGNFVFTGQLVVTTGPWFGGFYNPALFTFRPAGTMTFTLTTVTTGTLSYSIDGVGANESLERQTLVLDNYSGTFDVAANLRQSSCSNPGDNGDYNDSVTATVTQSGTSMSMTWRYTSTSYCTFNGTYQQNGRLGRFVSTYSCTWGETGNMTFFEMTNRVGMIHGRVTGQSTNIGCAYTGRFTGLDPNVY